MPCNDWVGIEHPISILDLSGIPHGILEDLVGVVLRILYDGLFWEDTGEEGGRMRPLLIALEEAPTTTWAQYEEPRLPSQLAES